MQEEHRAHAQTALGSVWILQQLAERLWPTYLASLSLFLCKLQNCEDWRPHTGLAPI